jgi:hypothetical protein
LVGGEPDGFDHLLLDSVSNSPEMKMITTPTIATPFHVSAMGRPLDPHYPSNLLAIAGSVGTGIVFAIFNLFASEPLASSPFAAGMAVFLAWAIGREIDPDNNAAAALAMLVAAVYSVLAAPSVMLGAGMLITSRLASGTVGIYLKSIDRIVLIALGGLLGAGATTAAALPALIAAILIIQPRVIQTLFLAIGTATAGALVYSLRQPEVARTSLEPSSLVALAIIGLAVARILPAADPVSPTDIGGREIQGRRVTSARVAVAATIVLAFILAGNHGIEQSVGTGGAAILGVTLARRFPATLWKAT